jgi:hypothetical protein
VQSCPFPPTTPSWSPAVVPTLHSPEHFVVHGLERLGSRHGGGEPSAEEPERTSGRGDCGSRQREEAHGAAECTPRLSPAGTRARRVTRQRAANGRQGREQGTPGTPGRAGDEPAPRLPGKRAPASAPRPRTQGVGPHCCK